MWLPELDANGPVNPLPDHDAMPIYRTTKASFINSTIYTEGANVASLNWPAPGVEPVNPEAYRVMNYWQGNAHSGFIRNRRPYDQSRRVLDLPPICALEEAAAAQRSENPPMGARASA
jgi:hypothetical protein